MAKKLYGVHLKSLKLSKSLLVQGYEGMSCGGLEELVDSVCDSLDIRPTLVWFLICLHSEIVAWNVFEKWVKQPVFLSCLSKTKCLETGKIRCYFKTISFELSFVLCIMWVNIIWGYWSLTITKVVHCIHIWYQDTYIHTYIHRYIDTVLVQR